MTPFDFSRSAKHLLENGEETIYSTAVARSASEQFCAVAESLGWICLRKHSCLEQKASQRLIVVGVATWAPNELKLLDQLAATSPPFAIAVLDVDEIETQEAMARLFPGTIGYFKMTPLLGEYEHGAGTVMQGADAVLRLSEIVRMAI